MQVLRYGGRGPARLEAASEVRPERQNSEASGVDEDGKHRKFGGCPETEKGQIPGVIPGTKPFYQQ